jgi:hypothetical protein
MPVASVKEKKVVANEGPSAMMMYNNSPGSRNRYGIQRDFPPPK